MELIVKTIYAHLNIFLDMQRVHMVGEHMPNVRDKNTNIISVSYIESEIVKLFPVYITP